MRQRKGLQADILDPIGTKLLCRPLRGAIVLCASRQARAEIGKLLQSGKRMAAYKNVACNLLGRGRRCRRGWGIGRLRKRDAETQDHRKYDCRR